MHGDFKRWLSVSVPQWFKDFDPQSIRDLKGKSNTPNNFRN